MQSRNLLWLPSVVLGSLSATAHAFTETFESGNEGAWTWGNPQTHIEATGGNPDAYLSSGQYLDTFAPILRTQTTASAFQGDYRGLGVTGVGVDLVQLSSFTTTGGRPCTLMLIHDNGTPGDPLDDTSAYYLGPNIPAFGEGWVSYEYDVPSGDTTLPAGWQLLNLGDIGAPPVHDWDTVIQDVSRVQFFYGNPTFFFIFQQWEVGADNVRIDSDPATSAEASVETSSWSAVKAAYRVSRSGPSGPR